MQKPGSGGLDRQLVLLAAAHGLDEPEPRVISSRGDPRVRRAVEYLQINAFFMFYKQTKQTSSVFLEMAYSLLPKKSDQ